MKMEEPFEFEEMFIEPFDINKHDYTGKVSLNTYIDKMLTDKFESQFPRDVNRLHGKVNDEPNDINDRLNSVETISEENKFKHFSDKFDTFIKSYVSIPDEDITTFKKLTTHLIKPFMYSMTI